MTQTNAIHDKFLRDLSVNLPSLLRYCISAIMRLFTIILSRVIKYFMISKCEMGILNRSATVRLLDGLGSEGMGFVGYCYSWGRNRILKDVGNPRDSIR